MLTVEEPRDGADLKRRAAAPPSDERQRYRPADNGRHPFREGSGRTQREFIRQLAEHAGHPLSWAGFLQQEILQASILSHVQGDNANLANIVERALYSVRGDDPLP